MNKSKHDIRVVEAGCQGHGVLCLTLGALCPLVKEVSPAIKSQTSLPRLVSCCRRREEHSGAGAVPVAGRSTAREK